MKKWKMRLLSIVLAVTMLVSTESTVVMAASVSENGALQEENPETEVTDAETENTGSEDESEQEDLEMNQEAVVVRSTNSFGEILAEEIDGKAEEQSENSGYNVFSIEVVGKKATVSFETLKDCTLLIGIYDEAGEKLLASGSTEVKAGQESAAVEIVTDSMPQYFYVRGFLIDTVNFKPLCTAYVSPNYTKEMQDFLAKTTDDFVAEQVLNLDEDKTNNFAVYADDVEVISKSADETVNHIATLDEINNQYVIQNADSQFTSLQSGDTFAYEYGEGEILIVQIDSIQVDGTTVTITGNDTSAEDVFDYIKIDTGSTTENATVDASSCPEGVAYNGKVDYTEETVVSTEGVLETEGEGSDSTGISFSFTGVKLGTDNGSATLTGKFDASLENTFKLYKTGSYHYVELKIKYSGKLSAAVSGKAAGEIHLATIGFMPVPGICIEMAMSVKVELSAKLEFSAKISGAFGMSVSTDEGIKDISSAPKVTAQIKGEVSLFVGLGLQPRVAVISEKIAYIGMDGTLGGEIKGTLVLWDSTNNANEKHDCKRCVDGEINAKFSLQFEAKLFNSDKLKFTYRLMDAQVKICDWYYSFDYNTWALTPCPHRTYKVTVTVVDSNGTPVSGASVNNGTNSFFTNSDGKVSFYLSGGEQKITAQKEGVGKCYYVITVADQAKSVKVVLKGSVSGGSGTADIFDGTTITLSSLDLKATYKDETGKNQVLELTENGDFELPYNVDINMKLDFILGTADAIDAGTEYVYQLPTSIRVDVEATHPLSNGEGNSIGTVKIAKDGTLSFQFDKDVIGTSQNTRFYVQFDGGLNEDLQEAGKEVDISFPTSGGSFDFSITTTDSTEDTEEVGNDINPEQVEAELQAESLDINTSSGNVSFTDLQPEAVYNFYIMKSRNADEPYSADNLLYISQEMSDGNGNLNASYDAKALWNNADAFVVCMNSINISDAKVTIPDLTYTGAEQYVTATVTLNGKTLTAGTDYELSGAYSATDAGEYRVTINGIGDYSGFVDATYQMVDSSTGTGNNGGGTGSGNETGESGSLEPDPNTGSDKEDIPSGPDTWKSKSGTEGFVYRLYNVALCREADDAGLNDWNHKLKTKEQSAAQVAQGFIFSQEFINFHYNNTQYVKVLYRTMFGREADEGGLNGWVSDLENGMSREYVFRGFAESQEFTNLCNSYGVERGGVTLSQYRDRNAGATGFIARLYTQMLGRSFDEDGLEYWCRVYLTREKSIEEIASVGFLHSQELANQNLSNEEFVTRMYRTFLNRDPEEAGLKDWVGRLERGEETRDSLVYGFTHSEEFGNLKAEYHLP